MRTRLSILALMLGLSNFSALAATPSITAPRMGQRLALGSICNIVWTGFSGDKVMIRLFQDNNFKCLLTHALPNNGSYVWAINPHFIGPNMQFKITSVEDPAQSVFSETFSIVQPQRVMDPKSGQVFQQGESMNIRWRGFSCPRV
jgi:hypothetical protein